MILAHTLRKSRRRFATVFLWRDLYAFELTGGIGNAGKILIRGSRLAIRDGIFSVKGDALRSFLRRASAPWREKDREMHQKGRFFQANKSSSRMKASFSHPAERDARLHAREVFLARHVQSEMRREEEKWQSTSRVDARFDRSFC